MKKMINERKELVEEYGTVLFIEKNKTKANELMAKIRKLDFNIQIERGRRQCLAKK